MADGWFIVATYKAPVSLLNRTFFIEYTPMAAAKPSQPYSSNTCK